MRLAVCALSAVLLSGCSWLGMGGHGQSGVNCAPTGTGYYNGAGCVGGGAYGAGAGYGAGAYGAGGGYGQAGYGQAGYGAGTAGYGASAGYGAGGAGYGAGPAMGMGGVTLPGTYASGPAMGMGGVGAGLAANGVGGAYGANGYTLQGFQGAYGAGGGVTTLGSNAAYGSAVYGQNVVGTQYANGQYVQGAGVQTIQGAPYYVPQPYPAYYGVPQLRGVGAALPFGVELDGGTDFGIGGDIFTEKPQGPADGDETTGIEVSAIDAISYGDAFGRAKSVGGTLAYDANRNTTLLGRLGYSHSNGRTIDDYATVQDGAYAGGVFTPGAAAARSLDVGFSDLEQFTIEGGVRQYMGRGVGFRPYVGATAGFIHNNDVDITQTFADGDATPTGSVVYNEQQYIQSGWNPTASATIGAEMAVGPRAAIGVESGIRWSNSMDTVLESEDRWSIPVKLRGRVAF